MTPTPAAQSQSLSRNAGEGDHAKHGGGGGPKYGVRGRPLHRLTAVPLPRASHRRGIPTAATELLDG